MVIKNGDRKMFWQRHVAAFRASGQTRVAYCREQGLKVHQLGYRLDRTGMGSSVGKSAFARVVATETAARVVVKGAAARFSFGGGVALELDTGTDPAWIARLIAHVGGRL
jgi:hypothetical protein